MATTSTIAEDAANFGREEVEPESQYTVFLRYPILFENATSDSDTNGLGALSDTISCNIVRSSNQFPTLQLTYKINGVHANEIEESRIIMADMGPDFLHQKFRVNQVQKSQESIIVNATHIAGDIAYNTITNDIQIPSASCEDVFNTIINNLADPMPDIRFDTDVGQLSSVNMQMAEGNAGNLLISPDQEGDQPVQSIASLFNGEWSFDDYHFYFNQHGGKNTGLVIKYGRNLKTINQDINIANTYTAGFFYAKYTPQPAQATDTNEDWNALGDTAYYGNATATYAAGGIVDIYSSPVQGHRIIGHITNGMKVQTGTKITDGQTLADKKVVNTVNGDEWYYVVTSSVDGWVDARWLTFDKSGDFLITNSVGHSTVKIDSAESKHIKYPFSGRGIVDYSGRYIRAFYSPYFGIEDGNDDTHNGKNEHVPTGRTFPTGSYIDFDWKAINEKSDVWYRVKNRKHCWVYGPHISFKKTGTYTEAPTQGGRGYVKSGAQKYVRRTVDGVSKIVPANPKTKMVSTRTKRTKKYITKTYYTYVGGKKVRQKKTVENPAYSHKKKKYVKNTIKRGYYKLEGQIEIGGETYYKTGNNTYVKSSQIDWKAQMSHKPKTITTYQNDQVKNGKIEMYLQPRFGTAMNWAIPAGTSFETGATAHGDGEDWTLVNYNGKIGWVLSKFLKNVGDQDFDPYNPDDVQSSDDTTSAQDNTIDNQDLVVKLDEGTLYAPTSYNNDVARVQNVDLSSYFQHDYQDQSGLNQQTGKYEVTQADKDQLRQLAEEYMREHRFGQPAVSLTLTAEQISDFQLDNVGLYDTVTVDFSQIGVYETAEVTSVTWDAMAHRYTEITIGELPITYEHALMDAVNKKTQEVSRATSERFKSQNSLLGHYHDMLAQEGSDRKAAEQKMKDELGLHIQRVDKKTDKIIQDWQVSNKQFESKMNSIDSDVQQTKSWIDSGGTDVIHAYPNWANPSELWAKSDAGGRMVLNNHGLEYTDDSGNTLRSAISSDGHIYAEAIDAGTISAVEIDSALVTGAFHFRQGGIDTYIGGQYAPNFAGESGETVANNAIMVTSPQYTTAVSSGGVYVTDLDMSTFGSMYIPGSGILTGTSIHPSYIAVQTDSNHVLTMQNFSSHAYNTIKKWVEGWVADWITVKGTRYTVWKGEDNGHGSEWLP